MSGVGELQSVHDAVAVLAGVDRTGWTGVARSEVLVGLLAARERLDAVIVAVTGEWDRDRSWELDGARSPVAWLAYRAPLTRQDASVLVRTSRFVHTFDQTAKALDAGDITAAHATIAAHAAKHRQEQYREHEDTILDAARTLPPSGFRQVMASWKAIADDTQDHDDARDQIEGNYLDIAPTFDGIGHLEITGVGPVSPAIVRMLACDAAIGRILLRGTSEVLDLGRRTNLSNLELRCRRHHILQHQRDHHTTHRRPRE